MYKLFTNYLYLLLLLLFLFYTTDSYTDTHNIRPSYKNHANIVTYKYHQYSYIIITNVYSEIYAFVIINIYVYNKYKGHVFNYVSGSMHVYAIVETYICLKGYPLLALNCACFYILFIQLTYIIFNSPGLLVTRANDLQERDCLSIKITDFVNAIHKLQLSRKRKNLHGWREYEHVRYWYSYGYTAIFKIIDTGR